MTRLTSEGRKVVAEIAARHGVSEAAAETLLVAVANGHGTQAQFDHPELGGMGQWSAGGMTMIGDMFNHGLKARVDALCNELSGLLSRDRLFAPRVAASQGQSQGSGTSLFVSGGGFARDWWPEGLGAPSSTGAQNDMRYAVFPETRRLAIGIGDRIEVFDIGDHQIGGVSQQQGGDRSLTFVSQHGLVKVADLPRVTPGAATEPDATEPAAPAASGTEPPMPTPPPEPESNPGPGPAPVAATAAGDTPRPPASASAEIISLIRQLAELRDGGILTDAEFEAKKSDLLARL